MYVVECGRYSYDENGIHPASRVKYKRFRSLKKAKEWRKDEFKRHFGSAPSIYHRTRSTPADIFRNDLISILEPEKDFTRMEFKIYEETN